MGRPALAACLALAACSFGVDHSGARYHCDQGESCPDGTACVGGYCEVVRDGSVPDGEPGPVSCTAGANAQVSSATGRSAHTDIAWTGNQFGVVWTQAGSPAQVYFDVVDPDGTPRNQAIPISDAAVASSWPTIEWTGSVFGAFWAADTGVGTRRMAYRVLSADGSFPSDMPVILGAAESGAVPTRSQVIRDGGEQGVAWQNRTETNDEVFFQRFDQDGAPLSALRPATENLGASWFPSLAWTGDEWGLAWNDDRDGNVEIYFTRMNAAGERIEGDRRITSAPGSSFAPSLIWTGEAYLVTWWDARADPTEMFAARLVPGASTAIGEEIRLRPDEYGQVGLLARSGEHIGLVWHALLEEVFTPMFALLDPSSGALVTAPLPLSDGGVAIDPESLAMTAIGSEGFAVVWADGREEDVEIYFTRVTCR